MCWVTLKPIFHQNANEFALGARVCINAHLENFTLGIPTCWYLKCLLDPKQTPKFALLPLFASLCLCYAQCKPKCKQLEYSLYWVSKDWVCADFMQMRFTGKSHILKSVTVTFLTGGNSYG